MLFKNKLLSYLIFLLLVVCGSGVVYEQLARVNTLQNFDAKGSLIDIGERVIHLDCRGNGSPIIIFESGLDTNGSLSWSAVHDKLAKTTRTCAYDRAGIMWSDPRPSTTNLMQAIANDLNKALILSDEKPPYVLVGHSFGGPYITKFTELYGDKVAGIVFIDSPHPEQMDLVKDFEVPLISSITNRVYEVIKPFQNITGITRILRTFDKHTFPNQSQDDANAVKAFASTSENTLTREISDYKKGLEQVSSFRDFGDRPMFVIGNIVNYQGMSDEQLANAGLSRELVPAVMDQDLYMFNDQASWSSDGKLKLLYNTSHYIQFDKPVEVISAVKIVVEKVKRKI